MRGIWHGETDPMGMGLIHGKEYEINYVCWNGHMMDVTDESGDDYLYAAEMFEITDDSNVKYNCDVL